MLSDLSFRWRSGLSTVTKRDAGPCATGPLLEMASDLCDSPFQDTPELGSCSVKWALSRRWTNGVRTEKKGRERGGGGVCQGQEGNSYWRQQQLY